MRGSKHARHRGEDEATLPPSRPDAPDFLSSAALKIYERVCDIVEKMGILTDADQTALARYAATVVDWSDAHKFLKKHGTTFPVRQRDKETGDLVPVDFKPWPQVRMLRNAAEQLLRLEREFGLTPSARSGIRVVKKEPESIDPKVAKFFSQRKA